MKPDQSSHQLCQIYDCWLHKFEANINFIYGEAEPASKHRGGSASGISMKIHRFSYFIDVTRSCALLSLLSCFYCPLSTVRKKKSSVLNMFFIYSFHSSTQLHQSTFIFVDLFMALCAYIYYFPKSHRCCAQLEWSECSKWQTIVPANCALPFYKFN